MKLVHWPLMGGLLHLVQQGGDWAGRAVPNITANPSTASVLISVLLYNGPLLCGFTVLTKVLKLLLKLLVFSIFSISTTCEEERLSVQLCT